MKRRKKFKIFLLFRSLRPVIVEPLDQVDDIDGYSEKNLFKKGPEFFKEREVKYSFYKSRTYLSNSFLK